MGLLIELATWLRAQATLTQPSSNTECHHLGSIFNRTYAHGNTIMNCTVQPCTYYRVISVPPPTFTPGLFAKAGPEISPYAFDIINLVNTTFYAHLPKYPQVEIITDLVFEDVVGNLSLAVPPEITNDPVLNTTLVSIVCDLCAQVSFSNRWGSGWLNGPGFLEELSTTSNRKWDPLALFESPLTKIKSWFNPPKEESSNDVKPTHWSKVDIKKPGFTHARAKRFRFKYANKSQEGSSTNKNKHWSKYTKGQDSAGANDKRFRSNHRYKG